MAAQRLHDLQTLPHARAQVRRAGDEVALVDVIGPHAAHEELLQVRLHHGRGVVDVLEQDGLVAERNAGVGEAAEGVADFGGEFARVVGVDADEERMKFFQHRAEFGRDALRQEDGDARADAEKFNVRTRAQLGEQMLQLVIAQEQGVAAAEEDVADFGMRGDVGDLLVELGMEVVAGGVADEARAGAIAAIRRAAVGDEE